jgi:hypothetical protein
MRRYSARVYRIPNSKKCPKWENQPQKRVETDPNPQKSTQNAPKTEKVPPVKQAKKHSLAKMEPVILTRESDSLAYVTVYRRGDGEYIR